MTPHMLSWPQTQEAVIPKAFLGPAIPTRALTEGMPIFQIGRPVAEN